MLENGGNALGHGVQWRSNIRLSLDDITVSTPFESSEIFESALCYDQLDISNFGALELVARQPQLCEERYRDKILGTEVGDEGHRGEHCYFAGMATA
eukprot:8163217-Pyramimonas_sp.AAC.1